jgi:hypothetical protein
MKTQLLCTFAKKLASSSTINGIKDFYNLSDPRLFVFEICNERDSIVITYNVAVTDGFLKKLPSTISIHRKKKTGTLYTLNAMNKIIEEENGGVLDRTFNIDWELYKNCLIITSPSGYRIVELQLIDVISR